MSDSQGHTVVTISIVFGVLSIIVMALRLFARVMILGKMGMDDGEFASQIFRLQLIKNQS